jgi:hypothetical protein
MLKVTFNSRLGPDLQFLIQQALYTLGLKTKRVSTKIDAILSID